MWQKINLGHTQSYIHLSKKRVGRMHTVASARYLDIYISRKIRLCLVDLEGKFQTTLQAKDTNFLI